MSDSTPIPLGKHTKYPATYDAEQLYPVPRASKRAELGLKAELPFIGEDLWNAYEISWLNLRGKPLATLGQFRFPCHSTHIVESKSFKLYLNSFNQSRFESCAQVRALMKEDLSSATGAAVQVELFPLDHPAALSDAWHITSLEGECLDHLDIEIDSYRTDPTLLDANPRLHANADVVSETLYSHLLKSNCLITSQPDWASVWIQYQGQQLDHAALLRYLISFRQHNEFHEQCVERIFTDLWRHCELEELSVYARYTRRGGLDINPWRSTETFSAPDWRLVRQ
ncbi:MAG: NADPH-dependent 7-cyano-7-deazaguanine reductase QueF [Geobacteraceae bacterium]|nr:NADPH-dependent 7-cyano-7-deazaguanine reductase QueF [Geobacteraceae bacterium]